MDWQGSARPSRAYRFKSSLPISGQEKTMQDMTFNALKPLSFKTATSVFIRRTKFSSLPLHVDLCLDSDYLSRCFDFNSLCDLIYESSDRRHLEQIHTHLVVSELHRNCFWVTKFVNALLNLRELDYARKMFDEFPDPEVVLWNAIIRGYCQHKRFVEAIEMYSKMQKNEVRPDCFTYPRVLKSCGETSAFAVGKQVHGQIYRHGFESNVFVQNSLVALYAKFRQIELAKIVFDSLNLRTLVSWTSIITGYAQNCKPVEALRIYGQMRQSSVMPDWITLVSVLKAYTDVGDLGLGKSIHSCVIKMGLENEQDLLISLTTMYAKCGQVTLARLFFDQMEVRDILLWNAMISGYAKNGYAEEAIELFYKMIFENNRVDSITIRAAILAFSQVGSHDLAKWIDDYVVKSEFSEDLFVNTALIDMYAKCGSLYHARMVFDRTRDKDVVLWSAMIMGYGMHGQAGEAIELYHSMKNEGVHPNDITYIGLLTACNHSGLVREGWEFFHRMKDNKVEPRHQHYSCVVDLLGRAGYLDQAYEFINNMSIKPEVSIWGALLSACKTHRQVTLGERVAERLFSLDPHNIGHYVQLSNLYAAACEWDRVENIRVLMKERGLNKGLGYSSI